MFRFHTRTQAQTAMLARTLAAHVHAGCVITLEGTLGVGKTTFVQSFARALGVKQYVRSPTFAIVHEYVDIAPPLVHMDMYRIRSAREVPDIAHYVTREAISVIEWASRMQSLLPMDRLELAIDYALDDGDEARTWTCVAYGDVHERLCEVLRACVEEGV